MRAGDDESSCSAVLPPPSGQASAPASPAAAVSLEGWLSPLWGFSASSRSSNMASTSSSNLVPCSSMRQARARVETDCVCGAPAAVTAAGPPRG